MAPTFKMTCSRGAVEQGRARTPWWTTRTFAASTPSKETTAFLVNVETAIMAAERWAASLACAAKRARNSSVEYSPVRTNRSWNVVMACRKGIRGRR